MEVHWKNEINPFLYSSVKKLQQTYPLGSIIDMQYSDFISKNISIF